jgi:hypothetical protein
MRYLGWSPRDYGRVAMKCNAAEKLPANLGFGVNMYKRMSVELTWSLVKL